MNRSGVLASIAAALNIALPSPGDGAGRRTFSTPKKATRRMLGINARGY